MASRFVDSIQTIDSDVVSQERQGNSGYGFAHELDIGICPAQQMLPLRVGIWGVGDSGAFVATRCQAV